MNHLRPKYTGAAPSVPCSTAFSLSEEEVWKKWSKNLKLFQKVSAQNSIWPLGPLRNGKEFDLSKFEMKNNFKLPIAKLTGGENTYVALTGTDDSGCTGAKVRLTLTTPTKYI